MSTARLIPETWELTGDDARATLRRCGHARLLKDAFSRLRWADGFSHARSLAFLVALATIQGMIALVGLASAFQERGLSAFVVRTVRAAAPGPVANLLVAAVTQAQRTGHAHNYTGLILGAVGWLVTATTAMGQLERGLNRVYGVEQDRPPLQKYGLGLLLAASAGATLTGAVALLAFGRTVSHSIESSTWARVWDVASWPIGLGLTLAALALLFRLCPRRRQPAWSWLAFGATMSVLLLFAIDVLLGVFFSHSASFGKTYGPLAGMVALLLWSLLSSIAILYGATVAAQLEAIRADASSEPHDEKKEQESEPGPSAERHGRVPVVGAGSGGR